MAPSIIHLAITNELIKRLSFTDANRLKFGAVVVDAKPTILTDTVNCLEREC